MTTAGEQRQRGFDHAEIEPEWQAAWEEAGVFRIEDDEADPAYVLAMFPYTSGNLHMGHVRNYTITDAYARFERMRGESVLHPMGWDAFGLPAENAAEERDTNPREWTMSCIETMKEQMRAMGFGYDWDREVTTCEPQYYRWNQWLFKRFREAGLVDRRAEEINWCPSCETVLADEQVEGPNEVCWRCETPVEARDLEQWVLTITDYADDLLEALEDLDGWPANVREMQRNWIGRQEGASVDFELSTGDDVEIFTTRLDTIYGATFFALAPGHPVATSLAEENDEVAEYIHEAEHSDEELSETSGVFTGEYAINPATGEEIPVYVADYVLEDVGTGALYAVPAHDERDHAFAVEHDLEIRQVIEPGPDADIDAIDVQEAAYVEDGILVNSGDFDGLESDAARDRFIEEFDGEHRVDYRLRDWLISRQRYWGTPIPMIECPDCGFVPVPDDELPVELPTFVQSRGNPLDEATEWKTVECPECGGPAERETDTMDTFVDSSWYFLRYISPTLDDAPFDRERASDWMPVDEYVGGVEHAVMHLLYARFVTKVLEDLDLLSGVREPFRNLTNQGMVLLDGEKMSKSKGNVVSPQRIVEEYGADTARLFIMSAAQPEKDFDWTEEGVRSAHNFLQSLYDLVAKHTRGASATTAEADSAMAEYVRRETAATVETATEEFAAFRFNHALQAVREHVSLLRRYRDTGASDPAVIDRSLRATTKLLAPVSPHVAEELWSLLGGENLVAEADWPDADPPANYEIERRLVDDTREDIRDIVDVAGIENPDEIRIAIAPKWKHRVADRARAADGDIVGAVMSDEQLRERGEAAAEYAKDLAAAGHVDRFLDPDAEHAALERAKWLIEREFDASVAVLPAAETDADFAADARPGRPAIHIE
ncbi:MAG: leucine--tRNA ligase [Salinirussus sp.]